MSWDECSRVDTHTHTQMQIHTLKHAVCVPGGHLRLRISDLTAWQRERVPESGQYESVFVLSKLKKV